MPEFDHTAQQECANVGAARLMMMAERNWPSKRKALYAFLASAEPYAEALRQSRRAYFPLAELDFLEEPCEAIDSPLP